MKSFVFIMITFIVGYKLSILLYLRRIEFFRSIYTCTQWDRTRHEKMTRTSYTRSTRNLKKQAQVRRKKCGGNFARFGCSTYDVYILRSRECWKKWLTEYRWSSMYGIQNDDELETLPFHLEFQEISDYFWCSASYTGPVDSSVAFYTIFCTETQWSCSPYGTTQEKQGQICEWKSEIKICTGST